MHVSLHIAMESVNPHCSLRCGPGHICKRTGGYRFKEKDPDGVLVLSPRINKEAGMRASGIAQQAIMYVCRGSHLTAESGTERPLHHCMQCFLDNSGHQPLSVSVGQGQRLLWMFIFSREICFILLYFQSLSL